MLTAASSRPAPIVALRGGYGYGNFGDDALMLVAFDVVREAFPESEIVLMGKPAAYVRRLQAAPLVDAFAPGDFRADHIVYGGGTQFYSFPGRRRSLWTRVAANLAQPHTLLAKVMRRLQAPVPAPPVAAHAYALGVGIGPFVEGSPAAESARQMVTAMDFVSVRDEASYRQVVAWGGAPTLGSDLCYLPGPWDATCRQRRPSETVECVGIVVRDWPHTEEGAAFDRAVFDLTASLRAQGKSVRFVSFAADYDAEWLARLSDKGETVDAWDPERDAVVDFVARLAAFDLLVTARYHGAVFASLLGIPVVCIEVEQKLRLVVESLGDGARLWSYPFDPEAGVNLVGGIEADYASAVGGLAQATLRLTERAEAMRCVFAAAAEHVKTDTRS